MNAFRTLCLETATKGIADREADEATLESFAKCRHAAFYRMNLLKSSLCTMGPSFSFTKAASTVTRFSGKSGPS